MYQNSFTMIYLLSINFAKQEDGLFEDVKFAFNHLIKNAVFNSISLSEGKKGFILIGHAKAEVNSEAISEKVYPIIHSIKMRWTPIGVTFNEEISRVIDETM